MSTKEKIIRGALLLLGFALVVFGSSGSVGADGNGNPPSNGCYEQVPWWTVGKFYANGPQEGQMFSGPYPVSADPFTVPFDVGNGPMVIGQRFNFGQYIEVDGEQVLQEYEYRLVDSGTRNGDPIPCVTTTTTTTEPTTTTSTTTTTVPEEEPTTTTSTTTIPAVTTTTEPATTTTTTVPEEEPTTTTSTTTSVPPLPGPTTTTTTTTVPEPEGEVTYRRDPVCQGNSTRWTYRITNGTASVVEVRFYAIREGSSPSLAFDPDLEGGGVFTSMVTVGNDEVMHVEIIVDDVEITPDGGELVPHLADDCQAATTTTTTTVTTVRPTTTLRPPTRLPATGAEDSFSTVRVACGLLAVGLGLGFVARRPKEKQV